MLKNVHLKNLALIKESEFDLETGLNILTGETGSGKSIIIGAVNIALGMKANKSMIRSGADQALVELQFVTQDQKVRDALAELDIEPDGDNILVTRKITTDSSISKINGETVTLANLRKITSLLVDIHGQHEHQSLLDPAKHLQIVDQFAGEEAAKIRERLDAEFAHYRLLRKDYADFQMDEASLNREIELLIHEKKEIEEAGLTEGEDERLEIEYKKLAGSEHIIKALGRALYDVDDEEEGVLTKIQDAMRAIDGVLALDGSLQEMREMMTDIDSIAKDLSGALSHYIDSNQFDEERYHEIRVRLDLINHLKSRYGNTLEEILGHGSEAAAKLERYADYAKNKEALSMEMKNSARELNRIAAELSEVRKKAAKHLEPLIIAHLRDLNFADVRFKIDFRKTEKLMMSGFDRVEFLISANPGEPLAPLVKVASGGELSRVMLAIKSSAAEEDKIPTLIFDEIDTGISGYTAQKVAEKLNLLSRYHQIVCITHLPQIAAMADHSFHIEKAVEDGSTISGIAKLSEEETVAEIARLVGGATLTEAALGNARELKEAARQLKG